MWSSILFGGLILAFATFMTYRNTASWSQVKQSETQESEFDFLRRQHRRRGQANVMIGIVGVAVVVGIWVTDTVAAAIFWSVLGLLVIWIFVLAVADLISTRRYFYQLQQKHVDEHAALTAELEILRSRNGNGKKPKRPSGSADHEDA